MYKKQPFYTVRSIRFRRWSRKSYAAFLSLKRHVTIGCVGTSIVEALLHKGGMFHAEQNRSTLLRVGRDTGCEEPDTGDTDIRLLMGELCPQVTLAIGSAKECASLLVNDIRDKQVGSNGMFVGIQRRLTQVFIDFKG